MITSIHTLIYSDDANATTRAFLRDMLGWKNLGLLDRKEQPRWNPWYNGRQHRYWEIVPVTIKNLVAFETAAA